MRILAAIVDLRQADVGPACVKLGQDRGDVIALAQIDTRRCLGTDGLDLDRLVVAIAGVDGDTAIKATVRVGLVAARDPLSCNSVKGGIYNRLVSHRRHDGRLRAVIAHEVLQDHLALTDGDGASVVGIAAAADHEAGRAKAAVDGHDGVDPVEGRGQRIIRRGADEDVVIAATGIDSNRLQDGLHFDLVVGRAEIDIAVLETVQRDRAIRPIPAIARGKADTGEIDTLLQRVGRDLRRRRDRGIGRLERLGREDIDLCQNGLGPCVVIDRDRIGARAADDQSPRQDTRDGAHRARVTGVRALPLGLKGG